MFENETTQKIKEIEAAYLVAANTKISQLSINLRKKASNAIDWSSRLKISETIRDKLSDLDSYQSAQATAIEKVKAEMDKITFPQEEKGRNRKETEYYASQIDLVEKAIQSTINYHGKKHSNQSRGYDNATKKELGEVLTSLKAAQTLNLVKYTLQGSLSSEDKIKYLEAQITLAKNRKSKNYNPKLAKDLKEMQTALRVNIIKDNIEKISSVARKIQYLETLILSYDDLTSKDYNPQITRALKSLIPSLKNELTQAETTPIPKIEKVKINEISNKEMQLIDKLKILFPKGSGKNNELETFLYQEPMDTATFSNILRESQNYLDTHPTSQKKKILIPVGYEDISNEFFQFYRDYAEEHHIDAEFTFQAWDSKSVMTDEKLAKKFFANASEFTSIALLQLGGKRNIMVADNHEDHFGNVLIHANRLGFLDKMSYIIHGSAYNTALKEGSNELQDICSAEAKQSLDRFIKKTFNIEPKNNPVKVYEYSGQPSEEQMREILGLKDGEPTLSDEVNYLLRDYTDTKSQPKMLKYDNSAKVTERNIFDFKSNDFKKDIAQEKSSETNKKKTKFTFVSDVVKGLKSVGMFCTSKTYRHNIGKKLKEHLQNKREQVRLKN